MAHQPQSADGDRFTAQRLQMVDQQLRQRKIGDHRLLAAFEIVPRHEFVPDNLREQAYHDRPLPIGYSQTISQPFVVALMIELAGVASGDRVLDVGGGSGYQAALLAELGCEVTSVEIVPKLAREMSERLARLGYGGVRVIAGDALEVATQSGPFQAVIAAAAPASVPRPLIDCLAVGGRLVLPVGRGGQDLLLIEKQADGTTVEVNHGPVSFVPMTGKHS